MVLTVLQALKLMHNITFQNIYTQRRSKARPAVAAGWLDPNSPPTPML